MENEEFAKLRANLEIAVGRLNAIHVVVLVMARSLPQEVAAKAYVQLAASSEAVVSDGLATPVPNDLLAEMERVLDEVRQILRLASQSR